MAQAITEAIKAAAAFPFYGQAQQWVRAIDPLWKLDVSVEHQWTVKLIRETHICDCDRCDYSEKEHETHRILACTPEDAEDAALERAGPWGWEIVSVVLNDNPSIPFPACRAEALSS